MDDYFNNDMMNQYQGSLMGIQPTMEQQMMAGGYAIQPLNIDPYILTNYGFSLEEVLFLDNLIQSYGKKPSTNILVNEYGLTYEQARRIGYAYDICIGKVVIDSEDDLCKHLKKMFGDIKKIGIQDLAVSRISKVPRKALIGGIPAGPFEIYNSKNYPNKEKMYEVIDVTNGNVIIKTTRKPVLRYKENRFIEGIIEIKELSQDKKTVTIAVNKKHARLCNRFVIVASLKRPEFHHGMVEIICIEGSRVYVYAKTMGTRDTVKYNMGTQRIYDYGYFPGEINDKLFTCAQEIGQKLYAVHATPVAANSDFIIIDPTEPTEDSLESEISE